MKTTTHPTTVQLHPERGETYDNKAKTQNFLPIARGRCTEPTDYERLATAKLLVASGASIKEAADRVGLNYSAIRKRAWREAWPSSTRVAREAEKRVTHSATAAAATTLLERGAMYEANIAQAATKFAAKAAAMDPEELFNRAGSLERLDRIGRRTFRLDGEREDKNAVNIAILGSIGGPTDYEHQTMEAQDFDAIT